MCIGYYSEGWYIVNTFLLSPNIQLMEPVRFIIDTASETTILSPSDAIRIGLDFRSLVRNPNPTIGVGGRTHTLILNNVGIAFPLITRGRRKRAHIEHLDKIEVGNHNWTLPSLLGHDVLNRFNFHTSQKHGTIGLTRIKTAPGDYSIFCYTLS